MRATCILVAILAFGCKKEGSPAASGAAADALWDLAPDGTLVGWVVTPRGVDLAERGFLAFRKLTEDPDLARVKRQIDSAINDAIGSAKTLADLGIARDKGFAMFGSTSGAVFVIPVADRDKFVAALHGTRGQDADSIRGVTCKPVDAVYACATTPALLSRLGKESLRGKAAGAVGGRGDVEVYAVGIPLGGTKADIALAFELDPGQIAVRGTVRGVSTKGLGLVIAGAAKPSADPDRSSGFGVISIGKIPAPPGGQLTPLVTIESLVKSIKGPITASVAAGTLDVQMRLPLSDPAPMTAVIEQCPSLPLPLAAQQTPGACRLVVPNAGFELDAWVDGKDLRLGRHKGAPAEGKKVPMSAWAKDVADEPWTVALWGRGSLVAPGALPPIPPGALPEEGKALLRGLLLLNELGFAIKLDDDAIRFRGIVRTAWANPDAVVAKLLAITGDDIARGKAGETAKAIAAAAPDAPLAADLEAGQGGMTIPVAAVGTLAAVAIPAFMDYMKKSKTPEAKLQLNRIGKAAKLYYIEHAAFPKGDAPLTPPKGCCQPPAGKCPPADWSNAAWKALDFRIDDPTLYQYSYKSDGATFTATAVGDLDCDGIAVTYKLSGSASNGNPEVQLAEPTNPD